MFFTPSRKKLKILLGGWKKKIKFRGQPTFLGKAQGGKPKK